MGRSGDNVNGAISIQPPTSHWKAAKALARVSKLYGATKHVSICKAIISHGCLSWYQELAVRKTQQKASIKTAENNIEDEIMSTLKTVTEETSIKRRITGNGNGPSPNSAHPSGVSQPTLQYYNYSYAS